MSHEGHSAVCTAGWGPSARCHCTSCGRNFLHVGDFDLHRWHKGGADGCIDPIAVGLHQNDSGFYGTPEAITQAEERSQKMLVVRAVRTANLSAKK